MIAQKLWSSAYFAFLVINFANCQESVTEVPSIEETTVSEIVIETEATPVEDEPTLVQSSPPSLTPSISGNIVTSLVPSLMNNMKEAQKSMESMENEEDGEELSDEEEVTPEEKQEIDQVIKTRDIFKKRREKKTPVLSLSQNMFRSSVKNATAAKILLEKLQEEQSRKPTYHDPGFRSKKLVRVRPRAKTLAELRSESESEAATTLIPDASASPILTSNALLLDRDQKIAAPQGSQHFDWSQRKTAADKINNRFRIFRNQNQIHETTTKKDDGVQPTLEPAGNDEPYDSTEVHVVTSMSDEVVVPTQVAELAVTSTPASSYQYVSIGTLRPIPQENVLELERLFMNENLQAPNDPEKKKRKVENISSVDKTVAVIQPTQGIFQPTVAQGPYQPSEAPPIAYQAPSEPYEMLSEELNEIEPERIKDIVEDESINEEYEYDEHEEDSNFADVQDRISPVEEEPEQSNLDDMIIKSIEEALQIDVPVDAKLRQRDSSPRPNRNPELKSYSTEGGDIANGAYSFEYAVQEESSGITHSRKENADDQGVVRGVYEVQEPNCIIRRIEYQADHTEGFQILNMTRRSCQELPQVQNVDNPYTVTASATILPPTSAPSRPAQYEQQRFKPTISPYDGNLPPPPLVPSPEKPPATPPPIIISTQASVAENGYTVSPSNKGYISTPLPIIVRSQSGILVSNSEVPLSQQDTINEISSSRGLTGVKEFKMDETTRNQPKRERQLPPSVQSPSPPLFGGFQQNLHERPSRPEKPHPVYHQPQTEPTYSTPTFTISSTPSGSQSSTYDPFAFQISSTTNPQERQDVLFGEEIDTLREAITGSGKLSLGHIHEIFDVTTESSETRDDSTVVPVFLSSNLPELRRVPKDVASSAVPDANDEQTNEIPDDNSEESKKSLLRRNMLMNIILRPGGGDKSRALPRPKVDVRADGPNVIIVRMTFPDNENIQGLRAFTPTEPEAISQFSAINEILPPNTSVERIAASSSEESSLDEGEEKQPEEELEYEYYEDYEYPEQNRTERQLEKFEAPPTSTPPPVTNPTRPSRPPRLPALPPQPGVLLGHHPVVPPPPSHFKPQIPPPPPRQSNSLLPGPQQGKGQKAPRLFIQSSLSAGNKNFDYNVAIDRQDWRPLPSNFHPAHHF